MRVIVCGSRTWNDAAAIGRELEKLPRNAVVVHGACRGADIIAGLEARAQGLKEERHPAEWTRFGRAAGPKRNQKMLDAGADLVLAFHQTFDCNSGTMDMVWRAEKAGVEVRRFRSEPPTAPTKENRT